MKHIHILSPAKSIDPEKIDFAQQYLSDQGFEVTIGKFAKKSHHYFAGTIDERRSDFQWAIDQAEIDVILCSRGGYGCVQFIDALDWTNFKKQPKLIAGYSDITVFHNRMAKMGVESLHCTAPLNFEENTQAALDTLCRAISGRETSYDVASNASNIHGECVGQVVGGNLAIISTLAGTNDQLELTKKILFIEEIGEAVYALDRMLWQLKKSGQLSEIAGLIVGGMTAMKDSEVPYGLSVEEVILAHVRDLNVPVAFDFPAGHIDDNRAIILGRESSLLVNENGTFLNQAAL